MPVLADTAQAVHFSKRSNKHVAYVSCIDQFLQSKNEPHDDVCVGKCAFILELGIAASTYQALWISFNVFSTNNSCALPHKFDQNDSSAKESDMNYVCL